MWGEAAEERDSSFEEGLQSNTARSAHEVVSGRGEGEIVGDEVVEVREVGVEVFGVVEVLFWDGVVGEGVVVVIVVVVVFAVVLAGVAGGEGEVGVVVVVVVEGVVVVGGGGFVFCALDRHLPYLRQMGCLFFLVGEGEVAGGLVVVEIVGGGGCGDCGEGSSGGGAFACPRSLRHLAWFSQKGSVAVALREGE